jgi:hypothetical protein
MFLDCCHVCKTCAFHDALQAGKQKEVHLTYSPDLVPAGTILSLTQLSFFIIDIYYKGDMFRHFQTAIFSPSIG